jgi:hypothetical protein
LYVGADFDSGDYFDGLQVRDTPFYRLRDGIVVGYRDCVEVSLTGLFDTLTDGTRTVRCRRVHMQVGDAGTEVHIRHTSAVRQEPTGFAFS